MEATNFKDDTHYDVDNHGVNGIYSKNSYYGKSLTCVLKVEGFHVSIRSQVNYVCYQTNSSATQSTTTLGIEMASSS